MRISKTKKQRHLSGSVHNYPGLRYLIPFSTERTKHLGKMDDFQVGAVQVILEHLVIPRCTEVLKKVMGTCHKDIRAV